MDTAAAERLDEEPALGRWKAVIRRPDRRLRPFVRNYESYARGAVSPFRARHFPTAGVALIVGFGSGCRVSAPDTLADYSEYRTSFVAGMHDTYSDSQWHGLSYGVQLNFTPIGAHLFLRLPMHSLANRLIEFDDILGAGARRLVEKLREAPAWDARFRLLDAFVASRLLNAPDPSPQIIWAWGENRETVRPPQHLPALLPSWAGARSASSPVFGSRSASRRRRPRGCFASTAPSGSWSARPMAIGHVSRWTAATMVTE